MILQQGSSAVGEFGWGESLLHLSGAAEGNVSHFGNLAR
jgi:hypothetical protein